jgi:peptidoglycan/LPS O-acetylase OafA/YrhL
MGTLNAGRRHFEVLDGLRGLAALAVFLYHLFQWIPRYNYLFAHAWLAVDFFFALSGFVIDYAYRERLLKGLGAGRFLLARAIRLYPMSFVGATLGAFYFFALAWRAHDMTSLELMVRHWLLACLCLPAALSKQGIPWIDNAFYINGPFWSLFFEWIASLAFVGILAKWRVRTLAAAAVAMAAMTVLMAYEGKSNAGFNVTEMTWGAVRVAYPFLAGMLINRIGSRIKLPQLPFVAAGLLLIGIFNVSTLPGVWEPIYDAAVVLLVFPLILLLARGLAGGPLMTSVARGLGIISYPLYTLHYPLSLYCLIVAQQVGASALAIAVNMTVIIVGVATLFSLVFDIPLRRWLADRFLRTSVKEANRELVGLE